MPEKCKICGEPSNFIFETTILRKYMGKYHHCPNCGFLFLSSPETWLEEAYRDPINIYDTGIFQRNIYLTKATSCILFLFFNKEGTFLDYGGGYGIFVRMMRDVGFDFYWHDPHTENIFARGFEFTGGETELELVTSFECFEHFHDPLTEIEKILKLSKNIIFSTQILPEPPPAPGSWWYYAPEHGQHISFFQLKTLKYLARKYSLYLHTDGKNLHLFTTRKINGKLFKLSLKNRDLIFNKLVRKRMKSRTERDMEYLLKKMNL